MSIVCGFIFIPLILNFCEKKGLYDLPNERKVHKNAIPRLGGISFMPSMLVAFVAALLMSDNYTGERQVTMSLWSCFFLVSLLLIYGVGIIDDLTGLGAKTKFTVQIMAACLMPLSGLYINNLYGFCGINEIPAWVGMPLTVFIIVFIDNAINLIDGIDGLAGGLSFLALGGFLLCFVREGLFTYSILIAGLMGVLVPYLYFNVLGSVEKKQKIFMGDSGSLTLGFILGFLFIKFAMDNPNVMPFRKDSLLLSFTMLIVPMIDVVRVVIARTLHRRPLFQADKNHIHHKLMRAGMTQHQALVTILLLALTPPPIPPAPPPTPPHPFLWSRGFCSCPHPGGQQRTTQHAPAAPLMLFLLLLLLYLLPPHLYTPPTGGVGGSAFLRLR